jgi:hypothetical protein
VLYWGTAALSHFVFSCPFLSFFLSLLLILTSCSLSLLLYHMYEGHYIVRIMSNTQRFVC